MKKKKLQPIEYVIIGLMVLAGLLTIWRCFYTVDLTDESYIYADALATIRGNIPYAHNFTEGAGMSFVTMVFLWIYMKLVPSLAGVVLYMRLCFAILRLVEVYGIYRLLRRKHERIPTLLGCSVLVVWHYFSNYFSYNTISIWLFLLVAVVLYVNYDADRNKINYFIFGVMGVFSALAVFANPFYVVSVAEMALILLCFSPSKTKIKTVVAYCIGGITQGIVVLIGICVQVGFSKFIQGLKYMLIVGMNQSSFNRVKRLRKYFTRYWPMFLAMVLVFFIVLFFCKLKKEKGVILGLEMALLAGVCFAIYKSGWCMDIWRLGGDVGTAATYVAIALFFVKKNRLFYFISLPLITITFLELLCSKGGFAGIHSSFAVLTLLATVIVLYESGKRADNVINGIVTGVIFISLLIADVFYVYRDAPLFDLDTRIPAGVYKGIISTELRAECLPEIEEYLRTEINQDEYVTFRDCTPFAYLMFEGRACDVRTWDPLDYSYGGNTNPRIMYSYYKNKGHIPDKMIFISYGRDKTLSIDIDDWDFNDWTEAYYSLEKEDQINDIFKVKIYENNGIFDGDFSYWVDD